MTMKFSFILLLLLTIIFSGCEQSQSQILALRSEFDREIQAKDKAILELKTENSRLQELAMKASQSAVSPKELGETVAEIVAKRVEQQNAGMKSRLEELTEMLKKGVQATSAPSPNPPSPTPPSPAPPSPPRPKDPNVKHYNFKFDK